jgi:hypothetical protein
MVRTANVMNGAKPETDGRIRHPQVQIDPEISAAPTDELAAGTRAKAPHVPGYSGGSSLAFCLVGWELEGKLQRDGGTGVGEMDCSGVKRAYHSAWPQADSNLFWTDSRRFSRATPS